MSMPRKHHFISRFLLRGFADPPTDNGRLFVLDRTRMKVFESSPLNSGHRRDYNRVGAIAHPNPLVVEKFYEELESGASRVLTSARATKAIPPKKEAEYLLALVAAQLTRTPRFRRFLEGVRFKELEQRVVFYKRSKAAMRRFSQKQAKLGLPKECWTPDGFLAVLRGEEFSISTDDEWKIALSMQIIPEVVDVLSHRHWRVLKFPQSDVDLIISDAGAAVTSIGTGKWQPIGLQMPHTVVFLPISSKLVAVGCWPSDSDELMTLAKPELFNTASFANCLDQCFSKQDDVLLIDPQRGPTYWSTYLNEGAFPNWRIDEGEVADEFTNRIR